MCLAAGELYDWPRSCLHLAKYGTLHEADHAKWRLCGKRAWPLVTSTLAAEKPATAAHSTPGLAKALMYMPMVLFSHCTLRTSASLWQLRRKCMA